MPNFADYVHNFRNFYRIQRSLLRHQAKIMGIDDSYNMEQLLDSSPKIDSIYLSKPIFNGFLFGVNLTGIEKAARRVGINLFHKMDLIAGQEDRLTKYIKRNGLPCPKIATAVFSYHFKSVTVAVAQKVHRSTPGFIEVREFLGLYHPELNDTRTQESSRIGSFGLVRGGPKLKFKGQVMSPLNLPLVIVPEAMENNTNSKLIHFPALYSNYNSLKLPSDLYVYAGDSYHQSTLRKEIVRIGVALTSLADIPSTDRIFHTFCQQYMATVKYLVPKADGKGVGAWYDPLALSELDVLIVTTHKYDLRKALQGSTFSVLKNDKRIKQPNTFMIAVAWIMESSEFAVTQTVGSWLGLDWIGNYDMLLGSSRSIVSFYTRISATIGFQVSCFMECPIARYVGKANKVTDENAGMEYRFFGRRTKLPVHLLTTSSEGSKLADVLRMNSVVKLYGREDPLEDVNGAKDTKRRQQSNEFNDDSESSSSFCVIVRTNEREVKKLWYSVHSLVKQFVEYRESNNGSEVSLKLMLLDTDNNSGVFSKKLRSVAAILNQETHRDMVFVVSDAVNPISKEPYPMSTASNPLHGYDLVDNLLDELAVEPDLRKSQGRSYNKTDINSLQCSYVTISTGTISYPLNYVSKILKELAKNYADALDIQSVHIFESSKAEKTSNEDVSVLAKYIVRLNLLQQEELYLLDKTIFTRDLSQIETRFEQRLLALFDKAIHNIQRENKRFVEVSKRETSNKYRKKKMIL